MSRYSLEELSDQISRNSKILGQFFGSTAHVQPSFGRNTPIHTLPKDAPQDIGAARQSLIESSLRMFQLAVGPSEFLPNLAVGYQNIACLRWLLAYKIFHLVPLVGDIGYAELATLAQVPEPRLKSIARMAMTNMLFSEIAPNTISHSATSALLAENSDVYAWATYMCEQSAPVAGKLLEASTKWPGSVEKNQTAYNVTFDTDLPFFDHMALDPEKTKQFAKYMKNVTSSEATDVKHLLTGFDWKALGNATIVDVGGSTGNASITLAKSFPDLRFIVQDLPSNAVEGLNIKASLSEQVSSRIIFQSHDFFQPQPVIGADVYLLRMILHDWPNAVAIEIIRNLVPAFKSSTRMLIMDTMLPAPGSIPSCQERLLRARDLTMMQSFNSQERDLDDWEGLLKVADERLTLLNVVQPFGSVMSVMEIVLRKD